MWKFEFKVKHLSVPDRKEHIVCPNKDRRAENDLLRDTSCVFLCSQSQSSAIDFIAKSISLGDREVISQRTYVFKKKETVVR